MVGKLQPNETMLRSSITKLAIKFKIMAYKEIYLNYVKKKKSIYTTGNSSRYCRIDA